MKIVPIRSGILCLGGRRERLFATAHLVALSLPEEERAQLVEGSAR
jgi:hypothetical protein